MRRYTYLLSIVLIVLFGLVGVKALFHNGFYTSLDGWHNIARLYHYHRAIQDGQIPPRWIGDLASGYGYPLFVFSYHLPWIVAEPFLWLGTSVIDAVKLIFILGFIFSGIFMYLFVRDIFGEIAGFVSGIIYLWTPYRFAKILVGASMGEASVFLFLPLLFWGLWKVSRHRVLSGIIIGSVGLAGIILSHLMILPLMTFFFMLFVGHLFIQTKTKAQFLKNTVLTIILGLGLASYYWLPVVAYNSRIQAQVIQAGFGSLYVNHFVNFSQLVYSRWGYGPIISSAKDGEVSFQLGLSQWVGFVISLVILILPAAKNTALNRLIGIKLDRPARILLLILLFSFSLAIFLMLEPSKIIWDWMHRLVAIDYPWRFLALTTFIGALLCGFCVSQLPKFQTALTIGFLVIAVFTNKNHIRVNQYTNIPLSLYIDSEKTTNTFAEYLPRASGIDIDKKPASIVEPIAGLDISGLERNTWKLHFTASSEKEATITLNYLDFPGQEVYIEGKKQPHTAGSRGRIAFDLPAGLHSVLVVFEQTPLMRFANGISLASLFMVLAGVFYRYRSRPLRAFRR